MTADAHSAGERHHVVPPPKFTYTRRGADRHAVNRLVALRTHADGTIEVTEVLRMRYLAAGVALGVVVGGGF